MRARCLAMGLVGLLALRADAWTVSSTDCWNTNAGQFGLGYVIDQINQGAGDATIEFNFGPGKHVVACSGTVTDRFVTVRTVAGDVTVGGTLDFQLGADLQDTIFGGTVYCRYTGGTISQCAFYYAHLNLGNDYIIEKSWFTNTTVTAGNRNLFKADNTWKGDNNPVSVGIGNEFWSGHGLRMTIDGDSNIVWGVGLRRLDVRGNDNHITANTNQFDVSPYTCLIEGTNNTIMDNVFFSGQQGSVTVRGDDNTMAGNVSYSNETGFVIEGHRNVFRGNRVGTMPDGLAPGLNSFDGLLVSGNNNTIGGTNEEDRNVIAYAFGDGIQVRPFTTLETTTNCTIQGNVIGLNRDGDDVGGIRERGIYIWAGSGHTVGGPDYARNVIAAIGWQGIHLTRPNCSIVNNLIGRSEWGIGHGVGRRGNYEAIRVEADNVLVRDNVIGQATNAWGAWCSSADNVVFRGNQVGFDGETVLPNGRGGLYFTQCTNVLVGGTGAGEGNMICGNRATSTNDGAGVCFDNCGSGPHRVEGNIFGLSPDGSVVFSNEHYGILLKYTQGVTVGGTNAAAGNTIAGSGIAGIAIQGGGDHIIRNNRIGTDLAGVNARGNRTGILLMHTTANRIGGDNMGLGNIISGNYGDGVRLAHGATNNYVQANLIGPDADGFDALGNGGYGVSLEGRILYYAKNNWIGGTNNFNTWWREGNVICGNGVGGILLYSHAVYNYVDGNLIGLDTNGAPFVGNVGHGVHVFDDHNWIGVASGNEICGNDGDGIRFESSNAGYCEVRHNYIGVTRNDQEQYGNEGHGVSAVDGAKFNHIGGHHTNGNVIGGNYGAGVYIGTNGNGNSIKGNYIGYPRDGEQNTINEGPAVWVTSANETWVGGVSDGEGNVLDGTIGLHLSATTNNWIYDNTIGFDTNQWLVSEHLEIGILAENMETGGFGQSGRENRVGAARDTAVLVRDSRNMQLRYLRVGCTENSIGQVVTNEGYGVVFSNTTECILRYSDIGGSAVGVMLRDTVSNQVQYCTIGAGGTDPWAPPGNLGAGVRVENGSYDTVGGEYWPNNTLSGNAGHGVEIVDSTGVLVGGNHIGLDEAGEEELPNRGHGVFITNSTQCSVGGEVQYRNYIGGNEGDAVHVIDAGQNAGHVIAANRIGMLVPGWFVATNGGHGVVLHNVAGVTVGGTNTDYANFISGNVGHGVLVTGAMSGAHAILLNGIGTDPAGTNDLPNGQCGVALYHGIGHVVAGNTIAGNLEDGLLIHGPGAQGVLVEGNRIGVRGDGLDDLGNFGHGVVIVDSPDNTLTNNLISGNLGNGVVVSNSAPPFSAAMNNRISANLIGTDVTGEEALGNGENGILISHATFTYVGLGNVIGGNLDDGIEIWNAASHDNFIHGNQIGGSTNLGNLGHGVQLHGGDANRVGSTNAWEANVIGYNLGHGVAVFTGEQNPILGNAIYSNLLQGIRLGTQEYSTAECDGCPNRYQRQPTLTNVFRGSTHIAGVLETEPNGDYLVEVFATPAPSVLGYGEGEQWLFRAQVTTDGAGQAPLAYVYPYTTPTGWLVTATATDTNGNTSTFSPPVSVAEAPDTHGYGVPDFWQDEYTNLAYTTPDQAYTNDYDGDGATDRDEYLGGTDPESASSFLRVDIGSIEVPETSQGRFYTMERATNLVTGNWTLWQKRTVGTGGPLSFSLDPSGSDTFGIFRVRATME